MFASATLKLTAWYLAILMSISLVFSVVIYRIASSEVEARLEGLQQTLHLDQSGYILPPDNNLLSLRAAQAQKASANLFLSLFYANMLILLAGGAGSYWLARRTLRPIERSHQAQSQFVSDASHELRTPLAAMQTELEVALRQKKLTQAEVREILESNLEEVVKLSSLSTTLLQLSQLDQSDMTSELIDLADIASAVQKRYDPDGTRIRLNEPLTRLRIVGNTIAIEELLTILVDNALKYSPPDSPIDMQITQTGNKAEFAITNLGPGIPGTALPRIFERFYRVTSSRKSSGFGLGLSLAKQIVARHNGTLTVKSGRDQPTTFTVRLDLLESKK